MPLHENLTLIIKRKKAVQKSLLLYTRTLKIVTSIIFDISEEKC